MKDAAAMVRKARRHDGNKVFITTLVQTSNSKADHSSKGKSTGKMRKFHVVFFAFEAKCCQSTHENEVLAHIVVASVSPPGLGTFAQSESRLTLIR